MTDLQRLNELYAKGTSSGDHHERAESRIALFDAWPAVSAELAEARSRLAILEKIAARLVDAYCLRPVEVAAAIDETIDRSGNLLGWVRDLDAELKKAGESKQTPLVVDKSLDARRRYGDGN